MINLFPLHFQWATYTTQTLSTPKLVSQCLHYIPANVFCNVHSWKCRLPARKELCLCDLFSRYIHDHSWGGGKEAVSLEYFGLCNIQKVKAGGEKKGRGESLRKRNSLGGVSSNQKEQDSNKSAWELYMQIRLSLGKKKKSPCSKSSYPFLHKGKIANNYWDDFPLS